MNELIVLIARYATVYYREQELYPQRTPIHVLQRCGPAAAPTAASVILFPLSLVQRL